MSITRRTPPPPNASPIVATGGYGRGELAPGSDIDLLFVRPFKQTAWGESVIEFILYMLWDLGLKVGHATRSLAECVRLAKQDITIRTALLEARYLWGDHALYDELRKKFWNDVATGNGQDFVEAKLAERDERHARQGESRYLVEPNIKEGKGGLRDLQTLYWIGKYLYHVEDAADLVEHNVFTATNTGSSRRRKPFCGMCACICIICWAGRRSGCRSMCSRDWPRRWAITTRTSRAGRWKPSCAPTSWWPRMSAISPASSAPRWKSRTASPRPSLARMLPGFLEAAQQPMTISMSRMDG